MFRKIDENNKDKLPEFDPTKNPWDAISARILDIQNKSNKEADKAKAKTLYEKALETNNAITATDLGKNTRLYVLLTKEKGAILKEEIMTDEEIKEKASLVKESYERRSRALLTVINEAFGQEQSNLEQKKPGLFAKQPRILEFYIDHLNGSKNKNSYAHQLANLILEVNDHYQINDPLARILEAKLRQRREANADQTVANIPEEHRTAFTKK